jgi:hypothetical protein
VRIKNERDFWSGLLFVGVGVVFAVAATDYAMGPACGSQEPCAATPWARLAQLSAQPGPGYFPFGLGALLAVVGGVVLFKALAFESEGGEPIGSFAWRPLLAVVGAIAVFAALLQPLGLAISAAALVGVVSLGSDQSRWKSVLLGALVLAFAAWLTAVVVLKLAVPVWPRWFG